jgi:hyperosmotically inducible protein
MKTKFQFPALGVGLIAATVLFSACERPINEPAGTRVDPAVVVNEKETTARVEDALIRDVAYKFPEVTVQTSGNTIQLSGFVATAEQKDRAGEITKNIAGNFNVQNKITVKR